jgi:hypothetical protein
VVLDGALGPARDKHQLGNARRDRLFNSILDDGLVDDGQQFLRHCLGGGKEPGAQASDGKDSLSDRITHRSVSFCSAVRHMFGLRTA